MAKTVLAHGVFDVLHHGHVAHLEAARAMGDRLVVSITDDAYVNKGPGRPVYTVAERARVVGSLRCVDDVRITAAASAVDLIRQLKPAVYVKGRDYLLDDAAGNLAVERQTVEAYGGELRFTDTPIASASAIINRAMPVTPLQAEPFLVRMRAEYAYDDVKGWMEQAAKLRAVAIGERIIDRYIYVEPAGKSPKENLITFIRNGEHSYDGGVHVLAGHLSECVGKVEIPMVVLQQPPVIKKRHVQPAFTTKVFSEAEVPQIQPFAMPGGLPFIEDMVVVADFGHGLIPNGEVACDIEGASSWLAVTCQTNSLNYGFNRLTKWGRANYVALDEIELRLARCNLETDMPLLAQAEMQRMGCDVMAVTAGHKGAVLFGADGQVAEIPVLIERAADRLGAGDAWYGFTAPLVKLGAPLDIIGLVGAAAAAIHVSRAGNYPVRRAELMGFVKALLA